MKFTEILKRKTNDNFGNRAPVIAFIGSSITQGCFEIYEDGEMIKAVFDSCSAYPDKVKKILSILYPQAPVSIVNMGINGGAAPGGLERFQEDVVSCNPDLLVIDYALNDSHQEESGIPAYKNTLKQIFQEAKKANVETIFMTPNMMNTYTSHIIKGEICETLAEKFATRQTNGVFDAYIDAAREACKEEGVKLCDCYAIWKRMYESGVDTTSLLSNGLNHPIREMHYLFAWELVKTILND